MNVVSLALRHGVAVLLLGGVGAFAADAPVTGEGETWRRQAQQRLEAALSARAGGATGIAAVLLEGKEKTPRILLLGQADRSGRPLDADAVFELGSISKAMVGSLLARMAADGRVNLQDPVQRWLPELRGTDAGRLTLLSLATHTSGLPRLPMSWDFLRDSSFLLQEDPYRDYSRSELLDDLRRWSASGDTPKLSYSNLGYALLGLTLEAAAQQPLGELMRREIFVPAGADGASMGDDPAWRQGQVSGYRGRRAQPPWTLNAFVGAGALRASAAQMAPLLQRLRDGAPPFDAGAQRSHIPAVQGQSMGLGWALIAAHGDVITAHVGGTGGFSSFIGTSRATGRAVLLMANGRMMLDDLGLHLLNPRFPLLPDDAPAARSLWPVWLGAVLLGSVALALALGAWRPRSRLQQVGELLLAAGALGLVWAYAGWPLWVSTAVGLLLGLEALALLWRGRHRPWRPRHPWLAPWLPLLGVGVLGLIAWVS